jgi:hypothetical protein
MSVLTEFRVTPAEAYAPTNRFAVVLGAIMFLHLAIILVSARIRLTISRSSNELQRSFLWVVSFFPARLSYNIILWNSVVVLVILGFVVIMGHDVLRDFLIHAGPQP